MSAYLKCPGCGSTIRANERFCGICGMDTLTIIDPPVTVFNRHTDPEPTIFERIQSNRRIILAVMLVLAAAGGIYFWFGGSSAQTVSKNRQDLDHGKPVNSKTEALKDAVTYLPKAGLNLEFTMSYPGGDSGTMQRITAQIVPDVASVSELELMEYKEKQYGYVYHYFPEEDGVYLIYDQSPEDAIPILKNNLHPGLSWGFKDKDGSTVWRVLKMEEKLDLDFVVLDNCMLIEEKSDAVKFTKIIYYAPGIGRVMETTDDKDECLMIMTSLGTMEVGQAAKKMKRWASNYQVVKP